jgi:hypothetical protein
MKQLQEAAEHLKISLQRCNSLDVHATKEGTLIEFEALTSRFARVTDILVHKVYRAIDVAEFIEGGSLIDVINRADKRHLIDSVIEMRTLKDIRNDIAHEYISERIQLLHEEVLELTPKLLNLVGRAVEYCHRF